MIGDSWKSFELTIDLINKESIPTICLAHGNELIAKNKFDAPFLQKYTNSGQLVCLDEGPEEGLFLFDPSSEQINADLPHNKYIWDTNTNSAQPCYAKGVMPSLQGEYIMGPGPHEGKRVAPAFELLRRQVKNTSPDWAAAITGISASRIVKLAEEIGQAAFDQAFTLPIPWTDAWGEKHNSVIGRPVAFHAMRGLSAHSNGFQTVRGLAVLMSLLGTIDRPGGFRHKAPYPRQTPPKRLLGTKGMSSPKPQMMLLVADLREEPVPTTSPT